MMITTIPPKYEGIPLSAAVPLPKPKFQQEYPQLWIWADLWYRDRTIDYSREAIEQLEHEGWKTVHGSFAGSLAALQTQLYETVRLVYKEPEERIEAWYKPEDDQLAPVALAFSIEKNPPPNTIFMLNPIPLPQHGEYGLVSVGEDIELAAYYILDLPLEARQRWQAMNDALNRLSAPLKWPQFTQRHMIASDEIRYQNLLHSLTVQQHLAIGNAKADLIVQGALLGSAHIHVEELKKALRKDDWQQQWNEVRRMARDLAKDYYDHHLQQTKDSSSSSTVAIPDLPTIPTDPPAPDDTEPPAPTTLPGTPPGTGLTPEMGPATQLELGLETGPGDEQQPEPEPAKPKRTYRPRSPHKPNPIVAKGKTTVNVRSDVLNHELMKALRDPDSFTQYKDQGIAEHRHNFLFQKEKGSIIITIKPLENEGWETILAGLNTLGDDCIDTYIATMAIALEHNGVEHIREPFQISPDEILEVCGKKKSHGSYTPGQRAEKIKQLKTLSQARVIATIPGNPGTPKKRGPKRKGAVANSDPTVIRAEGAIIDLLSFKIGEYSTITGEEVWEKRSISIGEWATVIPGITDKTAIMLRQVLAYSAKNERYQKRLGVYLTLMFRINAKSGGIFERSMNALLEGAGIIPDKWNASRFREAIEYALQDLKRKGVIGNYEQIIEAKPEQEEMQQEIHERARGWWEKYAAIKWKFYPPEYAKEQYKKLLKGPEKGNEGTSN